MHSSSRRSFAFRSVIAAALIASGGGRARAIVAVQTGCATQEIVGEVRVGETFSRPIQGGLIFVLQATQRGWIVRIVPAGGATPDVDWAEVATPPFRSVNPLLISTDFGFRAQDIVGWNPREFHYVRRQADFRVAHDAYKAVLATAHPGAAAEAAVTRVVMAAAVGQLEVLDAALIPGTADPNSAASLVSSHFDTTAHRIEGGAAGPLGRLLSLRFRVRLGMDGAHSCRSEPVSSRKH